MSSKHSVVLNSITNAKNYTYWCLADGNTPTLRPYGANPNPTEPKYTFNVLEL